MPALAPAETEGIIEVLDAEGVEDLEVSHADSGLVQLLNRYNLSVESAVLHLSDLLCSAKPNVKLRAVETILKMHGVLGIHGQEVSNGHVNIQINSTNADVKGMFYKNGK